MRHSTRRSPVTAVGNMGFIGRVSLVTVQSCGGSAPFPGGTSADPKRPSVFGGAGRSGGAGRGGEGDGVDGVVVVVVAGVTRGQKAGATGIPTLYLTSHLRPPCIVRRCHKQVLAHTRRSVARAGGGGGVEGRVCEGTKVRTTTVPPTVVWFDSQRADGSGIRNEGNRGHGTAGPTGPTMLRSTFADGPAVREAPNGWLKGG